MSKHTPANALIFITLLFLAACAPTTTGGPEPAAQPPTIGATREFEPTLIRPSPSPTLLATPTRVPPPTRTPPGYIAPTLAPGETPPPPPTPTPLPPPPLLYYQTSEGLWRINERWQPEKLSEHRDALPSPDGLTLLIPEAGSLWLIEPGTNDGFPLANLAVDELCCARRWPGRPERLLVGLNPQLSMGQTAVIRLTDGALLWRATGADSYGPPAGEPGGQRVAFDKAGDPWLWDEETGAAPLDRSAFGLPAELRFGSPAWSPDGRYIAWAASGPLQGTHQAAIVVMDLLDLSAEIRHPFTPLGRDGWFSAPAWSPDGRTIAFVAEDQMTEQYGLWLLGSDPEEERFAGYAIPWRPLFWSEDSQWLLFAGTADDSFQGTPVHWFLLADSDYRHRLDIPSEAVIVDWQ